MDFDRFTQLQEFATSVGRWEELAEAVDRESVDRVGKILRINKKEAREFILYWLTNHSE